ncbi:hypothetical protein [Ilumatobacter sp.]|uniref:F0F1 ATP synthase subunit B family protein n=1 Tax=Ilumatobacter sp. TaxID=1967498 RepID=UPI003B525175
MSTAVASVATSFADGVLRADVVPNDGRGTTSLNPILPPIGELIIGTLASAIVFGLIWKFAGDPIKKGLTDRTARIQGELDSSAEARTKAEAEAAEIRQQLGDVDGERSRLFAEADGRAEQMLADGRARLEAEVADLEAKADADIEAAAGRGTDEMRSDISRHASRAIEPSVQATLDDETQQRLIENFIQRVGSGGPAVDPAASAGATS